MSTSTTSPTDDSLFLGHKPFTLIFDLRNAKVQMTWELTHLCKFLYIPK